MNLPLAEQLLWLYGQQLSLSEQPEVQSWIAPNPCPISCATKGHSVCRAVDTPVPET